VGHVRHFRPSPSIPISIPSLPLAIIDTRTGDEKDRKAKHKVVEQKRREKTKELVSDLQEILPNLDSSNSSTVTMNMVLQCAIDFLSKHQVTAAMRMGRGMPGAGRREGMDEYLGVSHEDLERAYTTGFMMASMGIAYAGLNSL
jgi:hypothetical protein